MRKLSTHLEKYTLENKLWKETLWKIHFGKKNTLEIEVCKLLVIAFGKLLMMVMLVMMVRMVVMMTMMMSILC